jgi:hypothetical protein
VAPFEVPAVRAAFLMASGELLRSVGPFTEGYRFGYEDVEWCWRARKAGVAICVVPRAHAFRLPPQLWGMLDPPARAGIESSLQRLVESTRGRTYAGAFRRVRRLKSLACWFGAASLNALLCGRSEFFANEAACRAALCRLRPHEGSAALLPPDIESRVRWEMSV